MLSYLGIQFINTQQAILTNGEALPTNFDHKGYTLTGAVIDPQTGRYRLEFPTDHYDGDLMLIVIQVNSSFVIYKDGQAYYQYDAHDPYKRIQQIPLTVDFYNPTEQKVIIEYTGEQGNNLQKILLNLQTNMGKGLILYSTLQLLSLGALLIMLIYAISLFVWKPSERYLFLYIGYIGLQLIWGSLTLLPQYTNSLYSYIIETIINQLSVLVALLTVMINLGLLNMQPPRLLKRLYTWYGAIGVYLVFFLLVLIDFPSVYKFIQYFQLVGGFILLTYACSQEKSGAWILLAGFAISQGVFLYSSVMDMGGVQEGIYLSFIRAAKLPYLFFSFSIMLLINYKFAKKFREAEQFALELKDINRSLDRIVEERTYELKRQQTLRHNMMMNVFHDLRSPLFVLKGCVDIISAGPVEVEETMDIMKDRIDFLTHLTDDLFLIEQLEDEKVLFASEQVDLFQLMQTIGSASKIEAVKKGVRFEIHLERSCLAWGDPYRLEQALQNLIVNAIYYTPENGSVSVTMQKIDDSIHITIKDTGKGIKKENIEKVFERYYHDNETDPHQSTGLGLSIAHGIIKQHHGVIGVESTPGIGSTFKVVLPALPKN